MTTTPANRPHGHIKLARRLFDEENGESFWNERRIFSRFEAWVDLIQLAQWKAHTRPTKYGPITLERGEFVASVRTLAKRWRWSVKKVWTFCEALAERQQVRKQRETHAGTVYLVVNYDAYQRTKRREETITETPRDTARKQPGNKNKQVKQVKQETTSAVAGATGRGSWLSRPAAVWEARMGAGTFPFGPAARALAPLQKAGHPPEEIAERLDRYLAETEARYVSLPRFAQTYAQYGPVRFTMPPVIDLWMSPELERLTRPAGM